MKRHFEEFYAGGNDSTYAPFRSEHALFENEIAEEFNSFQLFSFCYDRSDLSYAGLPPLGIRDYLNVLYWQPPNSGRSYEGQEFDANRLRGLKDSKKLSLLGHAIAGDAAENIYDFILGFMKVKDGARDVIYPAKDAKWSEIQIGAAFGRKDRLEKLFENGYPKSIDSLQAGIESAAYHNQNEMIQYLMEEIEKLYPTDLQNQETYFCALKGAVEGLNVGIVEQYSGNYRNIEGYGRLIGLLPIDDQSQDARLRQQSINDLLEQAQVNARLPLAVVDEFNVWRLRFFGECLRDWRENLPFVMVPRRNRVIEGSRNVLTLLLNHHQETFEVLVVNRYGLVYDWRQNLDALMRIHRGLRPDWQQKFNTIFSFNYQELKEALIALNDYGQSFDFIKLMIRVFQATADQLDQRQNGGPEDEIPVDNEVPIEVNEVPIEVNDSPLRISPDDSTLATSTFVETFAAEFERLYSFERCLLSNEFELRDDQVAELLRLSQRVSTELLPTVSVPVPGIPVSISVPSGAAVSAAIDLFLYWRSRQRENQALRVVSLFDGETLASKTDAIYGMGRALAVRFFRQILKLATNAIEKLARLAVIRVFSYIRRSDSNTDVQTTSWGNVGVVLTRVFDSFTGRPQQEQRQMPYREIALRAIRRNQYSIFPNREEVEQTILTPSDSTEARTQQWKPRGLFEQTGVCVIKQSSHRRYYGYGRPVEEGGVIRGHEKYGFAYVEAHDEGVEANIIRSMDRLDDGEVPSMWRAVPDELSSVPNSWRALPDASGKLDSVVQHAVF